MFGTRVPAVQADVVADDAYLLDVREDDEWQAGHAPTAVHIPIGQLVSRLPEVPDDRELVIICRHGNRSAQATQYLNQVGRRAVNLDGGMCAWQAARRPMVSENSGAPMVI